jgi:hypothetical protein
MTISLSESDRVLFFAPHPDDEGLAAAGLLQRVALVGAIRGTEMADNRERSASVGRASQARGTSRGRNYGVGKTGNVAILKSAGPRNDLSFAENSGPIVSDSSGGD